MDNGITASVVVLLLLSAQLIAFYVVAKRSTVWAYPRYRDQLAYLEASYRTYERIQRLGLRTGLQCGLGFGQEPLRISPNGDVLPLQAALSYCIAGASRMTALFQNFLYWMLLQAVLVLIGHRLTGTWSGGLLALGLLLTTASAFNFAGGLFDFRLDFGAMCLFGVLLCAVLWSNLFRSYWASVFIGLSAAFLGTFRHIAVVYLCGIFTCFGLVVLIRAILSRQQSLCRQIAIRQLTRAETAFAVFAALSTPVLWHSWEVIRGYYIVGHVLGSDKDLRAAHAGISGMASALTFYPRSLIVSHLGWWFIGVSTVLLTAAFLTRSKSPALPVKPSTPTAGASGLAFLVISTLIPLLALTTDHDKSDVVASIMVIPVLLGIFILATHQMAARYVRPLAVFVLLAGIARQCELYAFVGHPAKDTVSLVATNQLYDDMAAVCRQRAWLRPRFATDCMLDYLAAGDLNVLAYERHRQTIDAYERLSKLDRYEDPQDVFHKLDECEFALITTSPRHPHEFPFRLQMEEMHPRLLDWCQSHMTLLCQVHLFDRDVIVFVRPPDRRSTN
jgi:hypothetical protein